MTTPPRPQPPPARMKRVVGLPWLFVSVVLAVMVGAGGCLGLILLTAKEASEVRNEHAITRAQFDAIQLGTSEEAVRSSLDVPPDDEQEFENQRPDGSVARGTCLYYFRKGGGAGDKFQLCFQDGTLHSKNAL